MYFLKEFSSDQPIFAPGLFSVLPPFRKGLPVTDHVVLRCKFLRKKIALYLLSANDAYLTKLMERKQEKDLVLSG